jgi:hypothetical protein
MTTAIAVDSRSAGETRYRSLRGDFDSAYKSMMDSSREFNVVLMDVSAGLSQEERRARKDRASQAYENAHERFMVAVANLNEFMIGRIISSRSSIQLVGRTPSSAPDPLGRLCHR